MNKERREQISEAAAQLRKAFDLVTESKSKLEDARNLVQEAAGVIETMKDEEQEAFDNMPESLQNGDRGQRMSEIVEQLDQAFSDAESAESNLDDAIGNAESATE